MFNTNNFKCPLCRNNITFYKNNDNDIIRIINREINNIIRRNNPIIFIRTIEVPFLRYYVYRALTYLLLFYFLGTITIITSKMDLCYSERITQDNNQNKTKIIFLNNDIKNNIYDSVNDNIDYNYSCILDCF